MSINKPKILRALVRYLPHIPEHTLRDALTAVPGSARIEEGIALLSVLVGLAMREHPAAIADPLRTYQKAGLNLGLTDEELIEAVRHSSTPTGKRLDEQLVTEGYRRRNGTEGGLTVKAWCREVALVAFLEEWQAKIEARLQALEGAATPPFDFSDLVARLEELEREERGREP